MNHHNWDFDSGVPLNLGDRYYSQDLLRDFWFMYDRVGQMLADLNGATSGAIGLNTLIATQGTGDTISVTAGVAHGQASVTIPNSYAALPPSTQSANINVRIPVPARTNVPVTGGQLDANTYANATLNGVTVNRVKIKYKELDGSSRTRARRAGSYVYDKTASYELRIEPGSVAAGEIEIANFTGTSGGSFTVTLTTLIRYPFANGMGFSNLVEITASGNWVAPDRVERIFVEEGGGGGAGAAGGSAEGGGGGGGEIRTNFVAVIPGNTYSITIGAGGVGGAGNGTSGGNTTAFGITANGGIHAGSNVGGLGGSGGSGGILIQSMCGGNGDSSYLLAGNGGGSAGGQGSFTGSGNPGSPGGLASGGGGGGASLNGGSGGSGYVRIKY